MSETAYRKSKTSGVVAIRLPNEVLFTIQRRIDGSRSRWGSIGEYIKDLVMYAVLRPHGRRANPSRKPIRVE